MIRVAIVTTDNRDHFRQFHEIVPYFGTAPQALLEGFDGMDNVEVHVISCLHQAMTSSRMLGRNIYYHGLPVGRLAWMKSGYLGCIAAVRGKLSEIAPDIVHGQGTERDCSMDAVFSGYPNVLTVHGNMGEIRRLRGDGLFSFYGVASKLEKICLKRTNGVICITRYTREIVRPYNGKTWLLPNAVDSRYFDVKRKIHPTHPVLLVVGIVCPRKNQNFLIQALDDLAGKQKFELRFLGSATDDPEYGAIFLDKIQGRPWCSHAGFVSRDDLKEELAKASALILPSLEDNCPMVVLEAMAGGVPVIASKVGGVPDLLDEFRTGLFVNPLDAESMRAAVRVVLENPEQMEQMALTAKREASERFHPKVVAGRHLDIYREVLAGELKP